jgi:acyl carrier protein
MNRNEILLILNDIFVDIFNINKSTLTDKTSAKDVDGWDSVAHVMLITAIENKFAIRFTGREIAGFKTVGDLIDAVENKSISAQE